MPTKKKPTEAPKPAECENCHKPLARADAFYGSKGRLVRCTQQATALIMRGTFLTTAEYQAQLQRTKRREALKPLPRVTDGKPFKKSLRRRLAVAA